MSNNEFEQIVDDKFDEKGDEYATMGRVDPKYDR